MNLDHLLNRVKSVEQPFLVWVVAMAASAEALLEMFAAAARNRPEAVMVWGGGAIILFAIALYVEKVKRRQADL